MRLFLTLCSISADEVNALVLDIGTTSTRAGYAGEDVPRAFFPTSYASSIRKSYYIGDTKLNSWRPNMEIRNPMSDGIVSDWDAMERIWDTTFRDMLRVDPTEHPLLCTEPAWNTTENREKMMELAFEKFQFPAFYIAKDAVMTAFSVGRATALVLDSGGGVTSAVPVYDGYVLKKGILRQPVGGNIISEQLLDMLKSDMDVDIKAQYQIANKWPVDSGAPSQVELRARENTHPSFHDYQVRRVVHEFKESVCQVSEVTFDEGIMGSRPQKPFEFPDGYNNMFGVERYKVPEVLFQPQQFLRKVSSRLLLYPAVGLTQQQIDSSLGMHQLVFSSINSCDIDLRPLLFNNIVVTGGNTLFPGFNERLNYELPMLAPGSKVKIHAVGNQTERKCSSWLGGSILASLGTFHQLWISKQEYEEHGASIVETKCQ
ncbi:actin family [Dichotomocladium elegans]|nr:actin family [Dichotomocladium elegans]